MPRPREFDLDDAVAKATQAFLRTGYEGTSMCDLTAAMGIEKGSLYKAFTDKRSLYLEGLRRYLAAGLDNLQRSLGGHADAVDAIRAFLTAAATPCAQSSGPNGCLAVSAMTELAPHDADVRAMLDAHWARVTDLLTNTLTLGQRAGQVRTDRRARDLACVLTRLLSGIAVFARQRPAGARTPAPDPAPIIDTVTALLRP
jgi:TetR/AcrR family transcriptional repressor of nem operon